MIFFFQVSEYFSETKTLKHFLYQLYNLDGNLDAIFLILLLFENVHYDVFGVLCSYC